MCLLGGSVAEELHVVRETAPARVPFLLHDAADVIPLPIAEKELLEVAAASGARDQNDVSQVHKILTALHDGDEESASLHAALLQHETGRLLATSRARRMVMTLASELLKAGTLPAARWLAILAGVR
jgi:hypothetical protein